MRGRDAVCDECMRGFRSRAKLNRHVREQHGGGQGLHRCGQCSAVFKRAEHLRRHERVVHLRQKQRCVVCQHAAVDASRLRRHYLEAHGLDFCTRCGCVRTPAHCCPPRSFLCEHCGRGYRRQVYLDRHKACLHGETLSPPLPTSPPPKTGFSFDMGFFTRRPASSAQAAPMLLDPAEQPALTYLCSAGHCARTFSTRKALRQHLRRHAVKESCPMQ